RRARPRRIGNRIQQESFAIRSEVRKHGVRIGIRISNLSQEQTDAFVRRHASVREFVPLFVNEQGRERAVFLNGGEDICVRRYDSIVEAVGINVNLQLSAEALSDGMGG